MFCVGVCLFYLLIVQEVLWNKFNTRYTLSIWDWVYVLFWPIPFGWCIIKATWIIFRLLHELTALILIILTIKYRSTKMYRTIDKLLTI